MTSNKKMWWLLCGPSSGSFQNLWPMSLNPSQALEQFLRAFFCFPHTLFSDPISTQLVYKHLPTSSQQWSILFICIYFNFLEKKKPSISLLCIFVLLLLDLYCQIRMSIQEKQTDRKWSASYTIFLCLWGVYQTKITFHIFLTHLWGF